MKLFLYLSDFIVPLMIFGIICYGITMKIPVYDTFVKGAKDGFFDCYQNYADYGRAYGSSRSTKSIRISGISGANDWKSYTIYRISGRISSTHNSKMFSSSAATGLLLDVYKEYGTDSYLGLVASISMSCTETIFYTMSVYFMTAKVTKTRYTLPGALLATLAGLAASVVLGGVVK